MRIADLVPLRRVLGPHAMVIRVAPDGTLTPFEVLPALLADRTITRVLSGDQVPAFEQHCAAAVRERAAVSMVVDAAELVITPVLDNDDVCRFLVCWMRTEQAADTGRGLNWADLQTKDVHVRFEAGDSPHVIEASPVWQVADHPSLEMWPAAELLAGVGLADATMAVVIHRVLVESMGRRDEQFRIEIPRAEFLIGLVGTAHAALRSTEADPAGVILALPVELAVDPDLLPVIVHLRTMGFHIEMVGLEQLTRTLRLVNDGPAGDRVTT